MPDYLDPRPRARAATIALALYVAVQTVEMIVTATTAPDGDAAGIAAIAAFAVMVGTMVAVAMWIYRVNANAHSLVDGMTVTPGWNVGWFFVPIANLWKPFEGVRQSWQASADPADWPAVPVPALMRVWWGFWLVGSMVANAAFRLSGRDDPSLVTTLDVVSSAMLIVAGGALIWIVVTLTAMQERAHEARTFA